MKTVVYKGTSNFQEFGKADFEKADIDQGKLVFERDVPKEVSDEVFEALTATKAEDSPIFYDAPFEAGPDTSEEDGDSEATRTAKAQRKAAKQSAKSQKAAVTDSGTTQAVSGRSGNTGGTAGNGASTGGDS